MGKKNAVCLTDFIFHCSLLLGNVRDYLRIQ